MKQTKIRQKRKASESLSPGSNIENVSKKSRNVKKSVDVENEDEIPLYDVLRQKNIDTRVRLFNELKIGQVLDDLKQSDYSPSSKASKASKRGLKSVKVAEKNLLPERKSLRLQKIDAETGLQLPEKEPTQFRVRSFEERPRPPLEDLAIKDVAEWRDVDDPDELAKLVQEKTDYLNNLTSSQAYDSKQKASFDGYLADHLKKLKINPEQVCKVTPNRIFSMAVHPMTSSLLVAAGDKWGAVGLWNVKETATEKDGVEVFYPHSRPINCLSFNPFDNNQLVSTSYDGTVRSFDLEAQEFNLIYGNDEEDAYTGSHCHIDAHTYLVSFGRTGLVGLVDTRVSNQKRVRDLQVYERVSARMVSLHPAKRHLFMAPNSKGECCIFDMRAKTKSMSPVISLLGHTRSLSSATFSSLTGDSVVTVCWDNKLRIYDIRNGDKILPKKQIVHNNNTGQWLTTFKAEFHPRRDDIFFVGSMSSPRQMDVFNVNGDHHALRGEELTSICSVVKPHPSQEVIVGANSSGRVFVFM